MPSTKELNEQAAKINEKLQKLHRETWRKNILANIKHVQTRNKPLKIIGTERAVIIGAGPSIDIFNYWPKIKAMRVPVIAMDMAVKPCLAQGIVPDLVVTVDSSPLISKMFSDIKMETAGCFSVVSNPEVVGNWKGQRWFYKQDGIVNAFGKEFYHRFRHIPSIFSVGNVGGAALVIAETLLGIKNIYLAGYDFCAWEIGNKWAMYLKNVHSAKPGEYGMYRVGHHGAHMTVFNTGKHKCLIDSKWGTYSQQLEKYLGSATENLKKSCPNWDPAHIEQLTPGFLSKTNSRIIKR